MVLKRCFGNYVSKTRDVSEHLPVSEAMVRKLPLFWKLFGMVRKLDIMI